MFKESKINSIYKNEFAATSNEFNFLTKSFHDFPKISESYKNSEPIFFYKYNIGGVAGNENISILVSMIWELVKEKYIYAITPWETEGTSQIIKKNYKTIKWEYETINEYTDTTVGYIKKNIGFIPARSPSIEIVRTGEIVSKLNNNETGLFKIDNFQDFLMLPSSGLADAECRINIFASLTDNSEMLLKILNQNEVPTLERILFENDLFISIKFGMDRGYYHHILIYSKKSIKDLLFNIVECFQNAGKVYLNSLSQIENYLDMERSILNLLLPISKKNVKKSKDLRTVILFLYLLIHCINSERVYENRKNRHIFLTENEMTRIENSDYKLNSNVKEFNFRYRFLPYIEASDQNIVINDLQKEFKMIATYDSTLFKKLDKTGFLHSNIIDQYYNVSIDLRYNLNRDSNEKYLPTIIFMIGQGKILQHRTSFNGVELKLFLRLSIFDKSGIELAYCQKKVITNTFSNEFLSKYILEENSPFLNDLNDSLRKVNYSLINEKINSCRMELFN